MYRPPSIKINNRQYKNNTKNSSDRPFRDSASSCASNAESVAGCGEATWTLYNCDGPLYGDLDDVLNFWKITSNDCGDCCVPVYPNEEFVYTSTLGYFTVTTDCKKLKGSCCGLSKWMWIGCRSRSIEGNWECNSFYGTGWMLLVDGCGLGCIPIPPPIYQYMEEGDIRDVKCAKSSDIETFPPVVDGVYARILGQPWKEIKETIAKLDRGPQSITITVSYVQPPTKSETGDSVYPIGDIDGMPNTIGWKAEIDIAHTWWKNLFENTFSTSNGYANDLSFNFSVLGDEFGDVPDTGIYGELYQLADYPNVGDIRYARHEFEGLTLGHAHTSDDCYEQLGVVGGCHGDVHFCGKHWRSDANPFTYYGIQLSPDNGKVKLIVISLMESIPAGAIQVGDVWQGNLGEGGECVEFAIMSIESQDDTNAIVIIDYDWSISLESEVTIATGVSAAACATHELGHIFGLVHEMEGIMTTPASYAETLASVGDGSDLSCREFMVGLLLIILLIVAHLYGWLILLENGI